MFIQDSTTVDVDYDRILPMLPMIPNADGLFVNLSLILEILPLNGTDVFRQSQSATTTYRHPILYGVAFYALLLIIVGTTGNILTIVVLLRSNLRRFTTMRYLTVVAFADLCSLYSWNLNLFYKHVISPYQNDLEDGSVISCRLISFIAFSSLQLSSWYLALVSLDRCLNIYFLFWPRQLGRADRAIYIIVIVTIIIGIFNSHLFFLNGYREANCTPFARRTCVKCYARRNDFHYIFPKWERLHVIVYNMIPFSIMLICTYFIIRRTVASTNQRTLSVRYSCTSHQSSVDNRVRRQRQLNFILIFVTFLFVTLTTPVMIYNVFLRNRLVDRKPLKYIVQGILLCIQYTSHAINFFIYCYGASNFRHELNSMFACYTTRIRRLSSKKLPVSDVVNNDK